MHITSQGVLILSSRICNIKQNITLLLLWCDRRRLHPLYQSGSQCPVTVTLLIISAHLHIYNSVVGHKHSCMFVISPPSPDVNSLKILHPTQCFYLRAAPAVSTRKFVQRAQDLTFFYACSHCIYWTTRFLDFKCELGGNYTLL